MIAEDNCVRDRLLPMLSLVTIYHGILDLYLITYKLEQLKITRLILKAARCATCYGLKVCEIRKIERRILIPFRIPFLSTFQIIIIHFVNSVILLLFSECYFKISITLYCAFGVSRLLYFRRQSFRHVLFLFI